MEYFRRIMKKTVWGSLLTSIIFALLGIILIVNSKGTIKTVAFTLGTIFILIGIYKIINYVRNKGEYSFFNFDMTFGIISIIIGLITIVYIEQIGTIILVYSILDIMESIIVLVNIKKMTE